MKQLLPLIIISLFLASCGRSKNTTASTLEQYDLTQAESGSLSDVFSDVELTPLQYGGGDYPKMVDRLILTDNLIIVSDLHKLIHIFDIDGNYLSSSSERMGEGPEEFPFATGYSWNNYTNSLEILSPYRLSFYDENMNFKGSMRLPTYGGEDNNRTFFLNSITDVSDSICLVHEIKIDIELCRRISIAQPAEKRNTFQEIFRQSLDNFGNLCYGLYAVINCPRCSM